ncbi:MAG: hypothetical protein DRI94_12730 [Bacteroidetes bacterium]|nr:MAG: hypothetical protein DRI94_12730 [Bacteroidota bacterium]
MKLKNIITIIVLLFTFSAFSQNTKIIDKRAYNYYTQKDINEMPLYKIMQINYDFNDSYIIPKEMKRKINHKKVDVFKLSVYRKKHENYKIDLGTIDEKTTGKYIILKSQQEVAEIHKKIQNKYQQK